METAFVHGDVLFAKIKSLPEELIELKTNIVQEGENTGHAHRIVNGDFKLFKATDGTLFLDAATPLSLSHEEHNTGIVEVGLYKIGITKEYDYESNELRKVMD